MKVKEYISDTITQIIEGVRLAQTYAGTVGAVVNAGERLSAPGLHPAPPPEYGEPNPQPIEFEIYVTKSESDQAQGGLHVLFQIVGVGVSGKHEHASQAVNRVRFTVPVAFPPQKSA